jgi:hypothetical protein
LIQNPLFTTKEQGFWGKHGRMQTAAHNKSRCCEGMQAFAAKLVEIFLVIGRLTGFHEFFVKRTRATPAHHLTFSLSAKKQT